MSKIGRSRAAAERALKAELTVRVAPGGSGALTAAMRVDALADAWLAAANGWSTGTERTYASIGRSEWSSRRCSLVVIAAWPRGEEPSARPGSPPLHRSVGVAAMLDAKHDDLA